MAPTTSVAKVLPSNVEFPCLSLEKFTNLTTHLFLNEDTKCKTNLYKKHKMKCMRIMGILYSTRITIFNENGDRRMSINTKKIIKINKLIISS
jgi:hypothetical protein